MSLFAIINNIPYSLMLNSLQENHNTLKEFVNHWYCQIYKKHAYHTDLYGIFGEINEENTNKRIEFLEQIIKQLNKPSKTKKS